MAERRRQGHSFREVISQLNHDSIEAFNRGDVATCAGFYANDAILLLPDRRPVRGKKAIEESLNEFAASGVKLMPVEPVEVVSGDDLGCCAGTYRFRASSGGDEVRNGKFVTVFRQQMDGSWKAVIDSFFADTEPAA